MPFQLSPEWKSAIDTLVESGGCALTLGTPDVGKSTFCTAVARECVTRALGCCLVDGDTGQSEIGPPTTVGWAHVQAPFAHMSELKPEGIFFVGSTSPAGHQLQTVTGIGRMRQDASAVHPHLTVVDMPGLAVGPVARTLIESTIALLRPEWVVAIQRTDELAPVLSGIRGMKSPTSIVLAPSEAAQKRSTEVRAARRSLKFASYFAESHSFELDGRGIALGRQTLFAGDGLKAGERLYFEKLLGVDLLYSETVGSLVTIVPAQPVSPQVRRRAAAALHGREVHLLPPNWFRNILCGLADEKGRHLAIGIIERVDFPSQSLHIRAPVRQPGIIRQVVVGSLRLREDGKEIGRVGQGELQLFPGPGER